MLSAHLAPGSSKGAPGPPTPRVPKEVSLHSWGRRSRGAVSCPLTPPLAEANKSGSYTQTFLFWWPRNSRGAAVRRSPPRAVDCPSTLAQTRLLYSSLTLSLNTSKDSEIPGSAERTAPGVGADVLGLIDILRPQRIGCSRAFSAAAGVSWREPEALSPSG